MTLALLIDFGSTYTKLRVLDCDAGKVIGSAQGPSTVERDVNIGLDTALSKLAANPGGLPAFTYRLASSSAAGGLRMVTVGLVRELTAEAARQAALGAGAKLVGSFAYRLTAGDCEAIVELAPDIVLLCGGTDGGNTAVILHNAKVLAASSLACPIIVAGNRESSDDVMALFAAGGKPATLTDNVMPALDRLDIEPARAAIRSVFMHRIVHAKGIDKAAARFDAVLMPTPAAVLEGARLLADGTSKVPGLGSLVVIDPGGATTDVHSIGNGEPAEPGVIRQGLPEPYAKRTVEGDLGMRHNAASIAAAVGCEVLAADAGVALSQAEAHIDRLHADIGFLPTTASEIRFDRALARAAIRIAMLRHAGRRETVYTAQGPVQVQRGKDLGGAALVIGTGGVLVHASDPASLLDAAFADDADPQSLRPRRARLAIDREYLLYAVGLLAQVDAEAALRMGMSNLHSLECGVMA